MSAPKNGLDRGRVIDLSIQSGLTDMLRLDTEASRELSVRREMAFAHLVIEDFLSRSGQYLTNDVTREAAIAEAVAAEREACAQLMATMRAKSRNHLFRSALTCAEGEIRAREKP